MRESINNTFVFNIVVIFIGVIMLFLVGSISYSKAFKVKNYIVNTIDKYNNYNAEIADEINGTLRSIGYRVNRTNNTKCPTKNNCDHVNQISDYRYCVYRCEADRGYYYGVIAFMYFDVPIINGFLEFPVYGETKLTYYFK